MSRLGVHNFGPKRPSRRPWRCIVCDAPCAYRRGRCQQCRGVASQTVAARNRATPTTEYRDLLSPETLKRLLLYEQGKLDGPD